MTRGRPKLPEGEKMVHTTVRIPQWMVDACRAEANLSTVVRKALDKYLTP